MDAAPHLRGDRGVDQTLPLHAPEADEALGDHESPIVTATAPGTGVTRVQMALVHDLDGVRPELLAEAFLDPTAALHTATVAGPSRGDRFRQNGGMAARPRGAGGERRRGGSVETRLQRIDWQRVASDLDELGFARIPGLLTARECRDLAALWHHQRRFRNHVDLGRHRFGEGEYRYFAQPLPALVQRLRTRLYPPLARIADGWLERFGAEKRHPATLPGFLAVCREAGQTRPTPLLLRYEAGGYNCLHQDVYGPVAFPLQVAVLLGEPGRDFEGGEFLLVEQRPRMQSRGEAIALGRGEAIVFPNRERPVEGSRGTYRTQMRHGVSRVRSGRRLTLGIIFHDSR